MTVQPKKPFEMVGVSFLDKNHIEAARQAQTPRSCHAQCRNRPEILRAGRDVMLINNETAAGRDRVSWFCHNGLANYTHYQTAISLWSTPN